jgi:hypothetical protein
MNCLTPSCGEDKRRNIGISVSIIFSKIYEGGENMIATISADVFCAGPEAPKTGTAEPVKRTARFLT